MQPRLTPRAQAEIRQAHARGYLACGPGRHLKLVQTWWHQRENARMPILMVFRGKRYAKLRWIAWARGAWRLTESGERSIRVQAAEHGARVQFICEGHVAIDRLPIPVAEQMAAQMAAWVRSAQQEVQK